MVLADPRLWGPYGLTSPYLLQTFALSSLDTPSPAPSPWGVGVADPCLVKSSELLVVWGDGLLFVLKGVAPVFFASDVDNLVSRTDRR